MKPLKSLISKNKINKYTTKKSLIEENPFLVLPYNNFFMACSKIKEPDFGEDFAFWVLTFEDLDEIFLHHCPDETDIELSEIVIWPIAKFNSDNVEDIKKYISKYDADQTNLMDGVKALTWKEIKTIWDL